MLDPVKTAKRPTLESIARVVAGSRRRHKLTQEQLATQMRRSLSTIARWEAARAEPGAADLIMLESVLPGILRAMLRAA